MPAVALSDLLTDFGTRAPPRVSPQTAAQQPAPRPQAATPPAPSTAEIVAAEVKRAEMATEARLRAEFEAAIEAERERHAAELAATIAESGRRAGDAVAAMLARVEAEVPRTICNAAARVLGTFVGDDIRRRSLDSLAATVSAALSASPALRVAAAGPAGMLASLRDGLGQFAERLDATEAETFDLRIDLDGSVIETRMAEWNDALAEILA